jgi:hypothetical protein
MKGSTDNRTLSKVRFESAGFSSHELIVVISSILGRVDNSYGPNGILMAQCILCIAPQFPIDRRIANSFELGERFPNVPKNVWLRQRARRSAQNADCSGMGDIFIASLNA